MRERLRRIHAEGREYTWRAEIRRVSAPAHNRNVGPLCKTGHRGPEANRCRNTVPHRTNPGERRWPTAR